MIFKSVVKIKEAFFSREEFSPMVFEYNDCKVVFKSSPNKRVLICETTLQRKCNEKIKSIFGEMAEGVYNNSDKAKNRITELESKLKSSEISGYNPFDILPGRMQDYLNYVSNEMYSYAERTFKTIRWISGLEGPVNPFLTINKSWSFDGNEWHDFPKSYSVELSLQTGIRDSEDLRETVRAIVEKGNSEPLANELYLEAVSLKSSHPRSSLLIAIAAAETGVKQFIVNNQPDTKWIIENMPSPNIIVLISHYLPTLVADNKINGKFGFPEKTVMEPLRKGINMRNIIAHGGECSLTGENLKETIKAVRQLLILLDYYSGYDWALRHIDVEVEKELKLN